MPVRNFRSLLTGLLFSIVLVPVFIVGFAGISVAARGDIQLLYDLPPKTTEFVSIRHLIRAFIQTQKIVLSDYLASAEASENSDRNLRTLKIHLRTYNELNIRDELNVAKKKMEGLPDIHDLSSKVLNMRFANLASLLDRLVQLKKLIESNECHGMRFIDKDTVDVERHNFLVYYATNVQGVCEAGSEWKPSGIDPQNKSLYEVFFRDSERLMGDDLWPTLHAYLSVPYNQTYPIRAQVFLALYFQYLELATRSRYVTFGLNEFVVPSHNLKNSLPELVIFQDQLNFGLAKGFFQ
jgi:hypothetical protein